MWKYSSPGSLRVACATGSSRSSTAYGRGGAEAVTSSTLGKPVTRLGLADAWSESAPNDFLLDKYGLSSAKVADAVARVLKAK
jgi:transketolase C-terminal domain/subunit